MSDARPLPERGDVFDDHLRHEFVDQDLPAMMATMVDEPYVHSVPTLRWPWVTRPSTTCIVSIQAL